jgi:hypothetical protein
MSNIILHPTPASPGAYEFRLSGNVTVNLKIGYNHVTDSQLTALQENKFFMSLIEEGKVSVEITEVSQSSKKTKKTPIIEDPKLPVQDPSENDLNKEIV